MTEQSHGNSTLIIALITAGATILAGFAPKIYDRFFPENGADRAGAATGVATPGGTDRPTLPVLPPDPARDIWGNAISAMDHTSLSGLRMEQYDTQNDGFFELQREDRNGDAFFELYRVDFNADRTTDYWFSIDPATRTVTVTVPQ